MYTAGAAQALAKSEGIALGSRVVVAGAGPFLLPVAASLTAVGAEVLGIFEASPVRAAGPRLAATALAVAGFARARPESWLDMSGINCAGASRTSRATR